MPADRTKSLTVALLTPSVLGAVSTVAVRGIGACELVSRCFQTASGRALTAEAARDIVFGRWLDTGEELVVCVWSGEHLEVHCHGGRVAAEAIVTHLQRLGCLRISWQEVMADQSDWLIAQAQCQLCLAPTRRVASILLDQMHGSMNVALRRVLRALDDGDVAEARRRLAATLQHSSLGEHLVEPWKLVIAGRPNVGKSSLLNRLLGYQRAIVHDQSGTTRDVLTAHSSIDGWPVEFVDTAGVRLTADPIETEGVKRAHQAAAAADLCLLVFDAAENRTPEDDELFVVADSLQNTMVIHNKVDIARVGFERPKEGCISCLSGEGFDELVAHISRSLVPLPPATGAAIPAGARVSGWLRRAEQLLAAGQADECRQTLAAKLLATDSGSDRAGQRRSD